MKPVLSYVILALNLMVYGNGVFIALTQGGDASNDYFLSLAKINENVVNGEYYRCVAVDKDVTIVNLTIFRAVFLLLIISAFSCFLLQVSEIRLKYSQEYLCRIWGNYTMIREYRNDFRELTHSMELSQHCTKNELAGAHTAEITGPCDASSTLHIVTVNINILKICTHVFQHHFKESLSVKLWCAG